MAEPSPTPPEAKPKPSYKWGCPGMLLLALLILYGLQKLGCSPLQVHEKIEVIE